MEIFTKLVPRHFVKLGDHNFNPYEIYRLLDDLEGGSAFMPSITIHNQKMKKTLEGLGVIRTNIRGSSYPGPEYTKFKEDFNTAYDLFLEGEDFEGVNA